MTETMQSLSSSSHSFEHWWNSPGEWVEPPNQRRGGESGVRLLQSSQTQLYCKVQTGHTYRSLAHPFGQPTILRELKAYQAFAKIGVKTPNVVYCAAQKNAENWQAILVTEALTGFVSLEQWYDKSRLQSLNSLVLQEVANTLARLHHAGWQHGCCYPKHIFIKAVTNNSDQYRVEVALLDMEKSRRRWLSQNASRHDISKLVRHRGKIPEQDIEQFQKLYAAAFKNHI